METLKRPRRKKSGKKIQSTEDATQKRQMFGQNMAGETETQVSLAKSIEMFARELASNTSTGALAARTPMSDSVRVLWGLLHVLTGRACRAASSDHAGDRIKRRRCCPHAH
jgi:hypothetical protein